MIARRLFVSGAWAILLCGAVHLIAHVMMDAKPADDAGRQLQVLMNSYKLPGIERTTQEMMNGFSLTFSVLPIAIGVICLLVARSSDVQLRRRVAIAAAIAIGAESAVSIVYWFAAPTTFLVVAALAFGGSAVSVEAARKDAGVPAAR